VIGVYQSKWVCIEHDGFARQKANSWWRKRTHAPFPESAEHAVDLARSGALAPTKAITVRSIAGEDFDRIIGYQLGAKPPSREPGDDDGADEFVTPRPVEEFDDIPF